MAGLTKAQYNTSHKFTYGIKQFHQKDHFSVKTYFKLSIFRLDYFDIIFALCKLNMQV